ncbi:hypothetical protein TNCV_4141201 [Trichonephila clavipes]|nr:hypothetical protein TNCV_4141201 [Trichonephila clavipes]
MYVKSVDDQVFSCGVVWKLGERVPAQVSSLDHGSKFRGPLSKTLGFESIQDPLLFQSGAFGGLVVTSWRPPILIWVPLKTHRVEALNVSSSISFYWRGEAYLCRLSHNKSVPAQMISVSRVWGLRVEAAAPLSRVQKDVVMQHEETVNPTTWYRKYGC